MYHYQESNQRSYLQYTAKQLHTNNYYTTKVTSDQPNSHCLLEVFLRSFVYKNT